MKHMTLAIASAMAILLAACGGGKSSNSTAGTAAGSPAASPAAASPAASPSAAAMTKAGGAMTGGAKMPSANVITSTMAALNGSKQTGTVKVEKMGSGVQVTIHLNNEPKTASEPVHIHQGTCAKINPTPWKALKNVVGGSSVTTVAGVTIAQLEKGPYAVNAHKSANDLATYVSCGNL